MMIDANDKPGQPAAMAECDPASLSDLRDITSHERPLVIRGLVRDWPVVRCAQRSDTAFAKYLASLDNDTPVDTLLMPPEAEGRVGYNADMSGFNYTHYRIPVTLGLRRLARFSREGSREGLAIQSAMMSACLPGFAREHGMDLLPDDVQPRIWIGNRVTTPAHFDAMHNIACVVCGARRFTLFPPDQIGNLYIGPPDYAPTSSAISLARLDRPDHARFPRLRDALAAAQVAELAPGDAIYIPPLWWHNVDSLRQLNALVNYWWHPDGSGDHMARHELAAFYHCILAFRALPGTQREAWRGLLQHYVFADEDPIAHVPDAHHGVLGVPPSAEQVAKLKRMARAGLDDDDGEGA